MATPAAVTPQTPPNEDDILRQYGVTAPPGASVEDQILGQYGVKSDLTNPQGGAGQQYQFTTHEGLPVYVQMPTPAPGQEEAPAEETAETPERSIPQTILQEAVVNPAKQFAGGLQLGGAGAYHLAANTAGLLQGIVDKITQATGLQKEDFLKGMQAWFQQQQQSAQENAAELFGGRQDLASQLYRTGGAAIPGIGTGAIATTLAGPVGGMAALGALETADQGWKNSAIGALQGALTGGALTVMGPASQPLRLMGAGAMTYAQLRLQGADHETALANAMIMSGLAGAGPGGVPLRGMLQNLPLPEGQAILPALFPNRNPKELNALQYLQNQGVPVPAGVMTGNEFVRGLQKGVESTPGGAYAAAPLRAGTVDAMQRLAEQHIQEASPVIPPADLYDQFRETEADPENSRPVRTGALDAQGRPIKQDMPMPVRVGNLKPDLQHFYDEMQWMPVADRNASAGYQAVKMILNGPDYVPASTAEVGLGAIKRMAREGEGRNQFLAQRIVDDLEPLIDQTVRKIGGDEAMETLQQARQSAAAQAGADWLTKAFNKARAEGGFNRQDALWNEWLRLRPEEKRVMFTPEHAADLEKFFLGAKKLFQHANPSGTAVTGAATASVLGLFHSPFTTIGINLGTYGLAKLLNSPEGVKLLTEGLHVRPGTARGVEIADQLGRMTDANYGASLAGQLQSMADRATQRMRQRGTFSGTRLHAGIPLDDMADMVIWGAAKIGQGIVEKGPWRDAMTQQFGQLPPKMLNEMYGQARDREIKMVQPWKPGMLLTDIHPLISDTIPRQDPQKLVEEDVQRYLNKQVIKNLNAIPRDAPDHIQMRRLLTLGRKEFADQLNQPENGQDWYDKDTQDADRLLRTVFPELGTDRNKDILQKAMSSAVSNSQNPQGEALTGARMYEMYRQTGRVPEKQPSGLNWPSRGASDQIDKLNRMLSQLGSEQAVADFLTSAKTGREIRQFAPSNDELKLDEIGPGSIVLGPKVGRYFNDIMNIPQAGTTVDLWEMRSKLRRLGQLFDAGGEPVAPDPSTKGERRLIWDLHSRLAQENNLEPRAAQSVNWHYEQNLYRKLGVPVKTYRRSQGIQAYLDSRR